MEYQKNINLLDVTPNNVPRFITKKWVEVYAQSRGSCNTYKQIRFKIWMLRSNLCDNSDANIVVKGTITVTDINNDAYDKKLAFINNSLFISCISKINNTCIDNAEGLDIVMPIYSLIGYSKNYLKTTGCLLQRLNK